jgi:hypothetical protein
LLVRELSGELVVYDLERHEAHCLNRTAAFVFKYSNGRNTVAEIAGRLKTELNLHADEELVWLTLDRLDAAGLLEHTPPRRPRQAAGLGAGAAPAGPGRPAAAVTSILVPTPAEAAATCVRRRPAVPPTMASSATGRTRALRPGVRVRPGLRRELLRRLGSVCSTDSAPTLSPPWAEPGRGFSRCLPDFHGGIAQQVVDPEELGKAPLAA